MDNFFDDKVLLNGQTSEILYNLVKELPIIDYHCHLAQKQIAANCTYDNLGQLWLSADHYKWRAMRLCGVDEFYITGDASWKEKFFKYAEIMPKLVGNPLYYWSHLELKQIFNINKPLNSSNAQDIYDETQEKLKKLSVKDFLKNYNVEYIATTDNPSDDLFYHKKYDGVTVAPTFRPDKILSFDKDSINNLAISADVKIESYSQLKKALIIRLNYFLTKGCKISDHGFLNFPKSYCADSLAEKFYENINSLTAIERDELFGNLLVFLMQEYKKRDIVVQMHFSVLRSVNTYMYNKVGADTGFDVTADECNLLDVIKFLDEMNDEERPTIILYSLNPNSFAPLASISGAFRNVLVGASWWFNDTLEGIKRNLSIISEYSVLGTHLGMLTDSRSFTSYSRFDFFRRILCDFVAQKVDGGECNLQSAKTLVKDICYNNIKNLLKI